MTYLAGGGAGLKVGEVVLASDQASLDITGIISSSYEIYALTGYLIPGVDTVRPMARVSTDNGATWDAGASDYGRSVAVNTGGSWAFSGAANIAEMQLAGANVGSSSRYVQVNSFLCHPMDATKLTLLNNDGIALNNNIEATLNPIILTYNNVRNALAAHNAIQFYFSAGNVLAGSRISVWGLQAA